MALSANYLHALSSSQEDEIGLELSHHLPGAQKEDERSCSDQKVVEISFAWELFRSSGHEQSMRTLRGTAAGRSRSSNPLDWSRDE
jgi:hypothetical protein